MKNWRISEYDFINILQSLRGKLSITHLFYIHDEIIRQIKDSLRLARELTPEEIQKLRKEVSK